MQDIEDAEDLALPLLDPSVRPALSPPLPPHRGSTGQEDGEATVALVFHTVLEREDGAAEDGGGDGRKQAVSPTCAFCSLPHGDVDSASSAASRCLQALLSYAHERRRRRTTAGVAARRRLRKTLKTAVDSWSLLLFGKFSLSLREGGGGSATGVNELRRSDRGENEEEGVCHGLPPLDQGPGPGQDTSLLRRPPRARLLRARTSLADAETQDNAERMRHLQRVLEAGSLLPRRFFFLRPARICILNHAGHILSRALEVERRRAGGGGDMFLGEGRRRGRARARLRTAQFWLNFLRRERGGVKDEKEKRGKWERRGEVSRGRGRGGERMREEGRVEEERMGEKRRGGLERRGEE
eukprot:766303-Hanusia_phi.AAC.1